MEHARVCFEDKTICLRDLEERDIPAIVEYWHTATPQYLDEINVDARKITTREETTRRVRLSLAQEQGERVMRAAVVAVLAEDEPADTSRPSTVLAYTNLHFVSLDEVYAHVHVVDPGWRSKGLASALFIPAMKTFVTYHGVRRLFFQTSSKNRPVNGFLAKFGLVPRIEHLETPDGFARAGEFCVYEIPRAIVDSLRSPAAEPAP